MMGRKLSEETKLKISKAMEGRGSIARIEKEFGYPAYKVVSEFLELDYLGKMPSLNDLCKMLGTNAKVLLRHCRKHKVKIPIRKGRNCFCPTKLEDLCWVRHGMILEKYIKECISQNMQVAEIALSLDCRKSNILNFCFDHRIKCSRYRKSPEEKGILRKGRWTASF